MSFSNTFTNLSFSIRFWCLVMTFFFWGCGKATDTPVDASSSDSGSTSTSSDTVSSDAKLYLIVTLTPESGSTESIVGTCENSTLSSTLTCDVDIPEAELYYGDIKFYVGTDSTSTCHQVEFYPYYYQASNTADFTPDWDSESTYDCSEATPDVECYGGVAKDIVTDFEPGVYTGEYFNTDETLETTYEADSRNSKGWANANNRWTANSLASGSRATTAILADDTDGYVANSMVDYTAICQDEWGDALYTIEMTIEDEDEDPDENGGDANPDPTNSASNDFPDWNATAVGDPI